jgi:hypothetical protein
MRNLVVTIGIALLAGCGSVTGGVTAGDGGSEHREDVKLVGDGKGGAGGAGTDAGGTEGGGDAIDVDGGDARDGNSAGVCQWPALDAGQCRTVRACGGAPGCAICCVTLAANSACVGSPPIGCDSGGGVRCVAQCAECGGTNPAGPAVCP